ncbi:hypothetical protein PAXRUDRAFT_825192 [Paxillus rubicundulus Ve08.2h10]|uniref:Alpha-ketoglutarate-dependent dioxygenase AlkB-like domain-containing protein n=1 Tax=Paxillus rubicundulus Ve08.2h10 TaxID=930991 RepID=A0A0D0DTH4_9AGAM|nr:hypothetical protein PAXRUDRAFT_825192 [Paxillus rubicundulus Ve08.2h10]
MLPHNIPASIYFRRSLSQLAAARSSLVPEGFTLFSEFFDTREQRLLLTTALSQLDALEGKRVRKLQKEYRAKNPILKGSPLEGLFLPEQYYTFQEGHYDNVIRDYREMHISSWPESQVPGLTSILDRLRALYPSPDIQTHLLHLSSSGEILPHIDNVCASGVWIMGVSLGATRMLRMASTNITAPKIFDTMLPSGSVYLQRDDLRYNWRHAVLHPLDSDKAKRGQRVSIMVRDHRGNNVTNIQ